MIGESLGEGQDYDEMKRSIVLSILDFTMLRQNQKIQNRFRFKEVEDNFELTDVVEIVFLEMTKVDPEKPIQEMSVLEKWLYFIKYADEEEKQPQIQQILTESEGITMAMEILKEVSADEQLRTRIRFQEKAERDRRAKMNSFWKDGLEQGLEQGREEGREEGQRQRSIEIAQKMVQLNMADDKAIVLLTGLTAQEVAALRYGEST